MRANKPRRVSLARTHGRMRTHTLGFALACCTHARARTHFTLCFWFSPSLYVLAYRLPSSRTRTCSHAPVHPRTPQAHAAFRRARAQRTVAPSASLSQQLSRCRLRAHPTCRPRAPSRAPMPETPSSKQGVPAATARISRRPFRRGLRRRAGGGGKKRERERLTGIQRDRGEARATCLFVVVRPFARSVRSVAPSSCPSVTETREIGRTQPGFFARRRDSTGTAGFARRQLQLAAYSTSIVFVPWASSFAAAA